MNRFPSRYAIAIVTVVNIVVLVAPLAGDDEITYPTETATLVVSITDQAGKPITGATITPYGCRCLEEPSTGWGWPTGNVGKPKPASTDVQGIARVTYPVKFGSDPDWMTTSEISTMVTHPEFISQQWSIDPRGGKAALTMRQGCQLTFSAVDDRGDSIEVGIMMPGPGRTPKWIEDESGVKRSRAVPDGNWQTMLVSPRDDGQHLFSGVFSIRLRDGQAVNIRNVTLRPGLRLRGRVSDDVPRPVTGGKIVANAIPKPAGNSWANENPSVTWVTSTKINDDGTFEFPSLPRSGVLQLITVCNGYLGVNQDQPEPKPVFRQGMFLDLDDVDVDKGVTIPMEPAGTVKVKVLKPDGQPLADAYVAMCPNQLLHLGGSTILGESWESVDEIRLQLNPDHELPTPNFRESRYSQKTNQDGIAIIGDLPIGKSESVYVFNDQFAIPTFQGGRQVRVDIKDTNPVELEIELVSLQTARDIRNAGAAVDAARKAANAIGDLFGN